MSLWKETQFPGFPALESDLKINTVIIGGGMAGILIANALKEKGVDNIIVEAKTIGSGQTGNTTAKITSQHSNIYSKIIKHYGIDFAKQYANANEKAISEFEKIIRERNIDCHFEKKNAVLFSLEGSGEIHEEYLCAKSAGISCLETMKTELPFPVSNALVFQNQAQFHPLKFLSGITDGLKIYENTPVLKIEENTVYTKQGKITAENIVVATHFPFINFPGEYFLRMNQERSYVLALDAADNKLDGLYINTDEDTISLRTYENYILLGGSAHRTGTKGNQNHYKELMKKANTLFPFAKVCYQWSAQDCITLDGLPYIGRFQEGGPNIYVATGFNKWGITTSMVSADIISDMICHIDSPNKDVFSPERFNLGASAKNLLTNTGETVKGFAEHLLPASKYADNIAREQAGEIVWNGHKAGAYRDCDGRLYIVTLRCPHLKCKLKWNETEKTWDCPCHGSRYDYKGYLIDNPSQKPCILLGTE